MNNFDPYLQMIKAVGLSVATVSLAAVNSLVSICVGVLSAIYLVHQIRKVRRELKERQ